MIDTQRHALIAGPYHLEGIACLTTSNTADDVAVVHLITETDEGDVVLTRFTPDEARDIARFLSKSAESSERFTALITAIGRDEYNRRCVAGEDPFGEYAGKPIEEWKL